MRSLADRTLALSLLWTLVASKSPPERDGGRGCWRLPEFRLVLRAVPPLGLTTPPLLILEAFAASRL
jgi:hypothetical protein